MRPSERLKCNLQGYSDLLDTFNVRVLIEFWLLRVQFKVRVQLKSISLKSYKCYSWICSNKIPYWFHWMRTSNLTHVHTYVQCSSTYIASRPSWRVLIYSINANRWSNTFNHHCIMLSKLFCLNISRRSLWGIMAALWPLRPLLANDAMDE